MTDNPQPPRVAALDLGSLTVRLAVAEPTADGKFRLLAHRRQVTGLGRGLAGGGDLTAADMDRTLGALKKFKADMSRHGVVSYRAVGTQALRQAGNRQDFLHRVQETLDLTVEVLSPEEEARLGVAGVLSVLNPQFLTGGAVIFDVGGGSSEFTLIRPGREPVFASLPLGVLTMSQSRPLGDPPAPDRVAALKQEITDRFKAFYQESWGPLQAGTPRLVGTAGAVTTLAALQLQLRPYAPDKINNTILTRAQVARLAERLAGLPEAERARLAGMEAAKAGVMVAGALIVLAILEVWRQDLLVVIDAGLLEGVLYGLARKFCVSGSGGKR
jgi:exopolyphosphatase/guanosine-5'-triphosphate,3'-diphosphate pyrophosphatase